MFTFCLCIKFNESDSSEHKYYEELFLKIAMFCVKCVLERLWQFLGEVWSYKSFTALLDKSWTITFSQSRLFHSSF